MANSTMPGSLIWGPSQCSSITGTPILPNNTNAQRVCGLKTDNRTQLASCCTAQDVQTYSCWQYCATNSSLSEFSGCLNRGTNLTYPPEGSFCQGNATSTIQQKGTSSAGIPTIHTPSSKTILLLICLITFFITPSSAAIIHSLDPVTSLSRRQSSSCRFT